MALNDIWTMLLTPYSSFQLFTQMGEVLESQFNTKTWTPGNNFPNGIKIISSMQALHILSRGATG